MSDPLRIWVDRHGRPCDSERHDAKPIEVVPVAERDRYRETLRTLGRLLDEALGSGGVDADTDKIDEALVLISEAGKR